MKNEKQARAKKTAATSKTSKSASTPRTAPRSASASKTEKAPRGSAAKPRQEKSPEGATQSRGKLTPEQPPASGLKARFAALATATGKISGLKNALSKNFFDVGIVLNEIRDERLYEVKGYGSFEAFVEREIGINKITCLRSARIAEAMHRDVALAAGLDRASAAVAALDGEAASVQVSVRGAGGNSLPIVPLHKQ